jgi:hypothetical protein
MVDRDELRRLAEAAISVQRAIAAYIAAANPARILALLDEVEALKREVKLWHSEFPAYSANKGPTHD